MKRFSIPPREERERHSHTMSAYHEINRIAWSFQSEYLRVVKCSLSVSGDSIIVVTLLSPIAVTVLIVNNQTVKQQSVTDI